MHCSSFGERVDRMKNWSRSKVAAAAATASMANLSSDDKFIYLLLLLVFEFENGEKKKKEKKSESIATLLLMNTAAVVVVAVPSQKLSLLSNWSITSASQWKPLVRESEWAGSWLMREPYTGADDGDGDDVDAIKVDASESTGFQIKAAHWPHTLGAKTRVCCLLSLSFSFFLAVCLSSSNINSRTGTVFALPSTQTQTNWMPLLMLRALSIIICNHNAHTYCAGLMPLH